MSYDYFRLSYYVVDDFYQEVLLQKRSYNIAADICKISLTEYLDSGPFEEMVILTTLIILEIRHNAELYYREYKDMKRIVSIYDSLDINSYFADISDVEFLEDDIEIIKNKLNKSFYEFDFYSEISFEEFKEFFIKGLIESELLYTIDITENTSSVVKFNTPYFSFTVYKLEGNYNLKEIMANHCILINEIQRYNNNKEDMLRMVSNLIKKYSFDCRLYYYDTPIVQCKNRKVTIDQQCVDDKFPVYLFDVDYQIGTIER